MAKPWVTSLTIFMFAKILTDFFCKRTEHGIVKWILWQNMQVTHKLFAILFLLPCSVSSLKTIVEKWKWKLLTGVDFSFRTYTCLFCLMLDFISHFILWYSVMSLYSVILEWFYSTHKIGSRILCTIMHKFHHLLLFTSHYFAIFVSIFFTV